MTLVICCISDRFKKFSDTCKRLNRKYTHSVLVPQNTNQTIKFLVTYFITEFNSTHALLLRHLNKSWVDIACADIDISDISNSKISAISLSGRVTRNPQLGTMRAAVLGLLTFQDAEKVPNVFRFRLWHQTASSVPSTAYRQSDTQFCYGHLCNLDVMPMTAFNLSKKLACLSQRLATRFYLCKFLAQSCTKYNMIVLFDATNLQSRDSM